MTSIAELGRWISENESLLSGMAALVVLIGVILSPMGKGMAHLFRRQKTLQPPAPVSGSVPAPTETSGSDVEKPPMDQPAAPEAAATAEPLLAVLAFDNLSNDAEMQFFSDGVSEEIIQRLARGARLKVIGRTSSFHFRGEHKAEAAQALHCSHVLDGSVRRAQGRVRISAHLVEAASHTTLWSDRYDRDLADIFAVQDEIAESIAAALNGQFSTFSTAGVEPATYDLYLQSSPRSFSPDELRGHVFRLEQATGQAPHFAEAWGRLAYLRAFLHFYEPFADRPVTAKRVTGEAARALALDPHNLDAMTAQLFVIPPFGRFLDADAVLERILQTPGTGTECRYTGWYLRTMGFLRQSLEQAELSYRLDALDPMTANTTALARMATGQVEAAIPVYEDLVERVPDMSFALSSLLRAHAFQQDWAAVDRLLAVAAQRQLREFKDTLPFVHAKRDPSPQNLAAWRRDLEQSVGTTGGVDLSRLVYTAHLGLVDEAYRLADEARLGPAGTSDDIMGPDAYRTSIMFQATMPELRNDPRFVPLCARLGLVEFWTKTGKWPDCADELPYDFKAECDKARHIPKDDFMA